MLAKDSVQVRLDLGLSFTEFSYMLLQSADFLHLHREFGVELQTGGADQWGNITAGLELIRRVEGGDPAGDRAHGLSFPLLMNTSGQIGSVICPLIVIWLQQHYDWNAPLYLIGGLFLVGAAAWGFINPQRKIFE
jgi:tyrosyl-tRNA synthetase